MTGYVFGLLVLCGTGTSVAASDGVHAMDTTMYKQNFEVIELRRYAIRDGERKNFARYFESWFPEAFQQLDAIAFGQFTERENDTWFTWVRGFRDMDARARVNAAFYYGPLWKEHKAVMNNLMIDSDNVLLLKPLDASHRIPVLPAVDPVKEEQGAQGIVVMQIFPVKPDAEQALAQHAERVFATFSAAGIREAGLLETLNAPNNFPQLPVRTDGPYLVWLGIVEHEKMLEEIYMPLAEQSLRELSASGLLRHEPESVVLYPTPCSRLRWLRQ